MVTSLTCHSWSGEHALLWWSSVMFPVATKSAYAALCMVSGEWVFVGISYYIYHGAWVFPHWKCICFSEGKPDVTPVPVEFQEKFIRTNATLYHHVFLNTCMCTPEIIRTLGFHFLWRARHWIHNPETKRWGWTAYAPATIFWIWVQYWSYHSVMPPPRVLFAAACLEWQSPAMVCLKELALSKQVSFKR